MSTCRRYHRRLRQAQTVVVPILCSLEQSTVMGHYVPADESKEVDFLRKYTSNSECLLISKLTHDYCTV
jgi:hypothetical protein